MFDKITLISALVVSAFWLLACGKSDAAPGEPALVKEAAGPADYRWQRIKEPYGSFEVPGGDGWVRQPAGPLELRQEERDVTLLVQHQADVAPDLRAEYLASLIDVNKRDAPKYQVRGKTEGQVAGVPAGRVDGTFDNGTKYSTRDYVVFKGGSAVVLMARGPTNREAEVRSMIDRVAASFL